MLSADKRELAESSRFRACKGDTVRKRSCPYCGRFHAIDFDCGKKPIRPRYATDSPASRIRSTSKWQKVREAVKKRDHYLCQLCLRGYDGTLRKFEYENTEVHHIVPIEEDESKAFDMNNLITLCRGHHEGAECGKISREELFLIISPSPGGGSTS